MTGTPPPVERRRLLDRRLGRRLAPAGALPTPWKVAIAGAVVLLVTASGVFAELQGALNAVWKAEPRALSLSYLVRARALSIGLVAATGFLLLVSLIASAVLAAFETWMHGRFPGSSTLLQVAGFLISFLLTALLFGAIFKVLPDRRLAWHHVAVGAVVTAFLFNLGKTVIGWYIGGSTIATSYGAAGALLVVLLWVYYSAQIFLLGAEFTKAWSGLQGSPEALAAGARPSETMPRPTRRRPRLDPLTTSP